MLHNVSEAAGQLSGSASRLSLTTRCHCDAVFSVAAAIGVTSCVDSMTPDASENVSAMPVKPVPTTLDRYRGGHEPDRNTAFASAR